MSSQILFRKLLKTPLFRLTGIRICTSCADIPHLISLFFPVFCHRSQILPHRRILILFICPKCLNRAFVIHVAIAAVCQFFIGRIHAIIPRNHLVTQEQGSRLARVLRTIIILVNAAEYKGFSTDLPTDTVSDLPVTDIIRRTNR